MADLVFKGVGKARAGREHVRGAGPSASRLGASPSFFDLYRCDVFVLLDVSAGLRLGLERDDVEDVTLVRLVRAPAVRSGEGELGRLTVAWTELENDQRFSRPETLDVLGAPGVAPDLHEAEGEARVLDVCPSPPAALSPTTAQLRGEFRLSRAST